MAKEDESAKGAQEFGRGRRMTRYCSSRVKLNGAW
jgi:hypothetical protein